MESVVRCLRASEVLYSVFILHMITLLRRLLLLDLVPSSLNHP